MSESTELKILVPDPLSALLQLHARRLGVDIKWSGKGTDDVALLMLDNSNKTLLSKQLWNGIKDLWEMPELKTLPEPVYAKICAIILAARARTDLDLARRNARANSPSPVPTDGGPARSM